MTAEQKETIANISSLASAGVGAAIGNSSANAAQGSLNAENAVDNNDGAIPAPIPLPIYIPKTQAQKEAGEQVSTAIQKTGRETIKTVGAGNAALWSTVFCQFDSGCESSLAAMNGVWNEQMGNDESKVAAVQTAQTSAGSPVPDPDDEDDFKDYRSSDLKSGDKIDLSKFSNRISQSGVKADFRDPKTGWRISPDRAGERGHGGSAWKLFNKQGKRIGTITKDGKFLRN